MKKSVWIPLLATTCVVAGAVAGAYAVMMKREKEMAEYEQMLIRQDIPDAKWETDAEAAPTEAAPAGADAPQAPEAAPQE